MSLARRLDVPAPVPEVEDGLLDQRVRLHRVPWTGFLALLRVRGVDDAPPRVSYLDGELELMSPGLPHESDSFRLARLLVAWSEEAGVELDGFGQWLVKRRRDEAGVEPDHCFILTARHPRMPSVPDFAVEVAKANPGLDKLEIYRRLGVREVWFWERGALCFHVLRGERYVRAARSSLLRDLDPALIARFMVGGSQSEASRGLQRAMRRARRS